MQNSLGNESGILSTSEEPPQLSAELPVLQCGQKDCGACLIRTEYLDLKDKPQIRVRDLRTRFVNALLHSPAPVIGKSSAEATAVVARRLNDYHGRIGTCVHVNGSAPIVEGFVFGAQKRFESENGPLNH